MGMRALPVTSGAVEGRGKGRGEIAIRAAAAIAVAKFEADLGGELFRVFEQRSASVALLIRRTVQFARHLDSDAVGLRRQAQYLRHQFVSVGDGGNTHVD